VGTPYVLAMEDGSFRMYYLGVGKFEGDKHPSARVKIINHGGGSMGKTWTFLPLAKTCLC
jgi:hypothetical protein